MMRPAPFARLSRWLGISSRTRTRLRPEHAARPASFEALEPRVLLAVAFVPATPYLSFADSPFNGESFEYYFLEDFEDDDPQQPNTLGVTASSGTVFSGVFFADSVDGDDGNIDGSGLGGSSFGIIAGNAVLEFTFDELVLGGLPTHVGIVWTDGVTPTRFEAFDADDQSLGVLGPVTLTTSSNQGDTAEDRFFGVVNDTGIKRITISEESGGGLEVDHLQYGKAGTPAPIPSDLQVSITEVRLRSQSAHEQTLVPGDKITASVVIANSGAGPAVGKVAIDLLLSPNGLISHENTRLLQTFQNIAINLPSGASKSFNFTVSLPGNLAPDDYFLIANVDTSDQFVESDEENNLAVTDQDLTVELVFGTVAGAGGLGARNIVLNVTDGDGTLVAFKLSGGGSARVIPGEGFFDLVITGTTPKSSITITTKNSGLLNDDGKIVLRNVSVGEPVGLAPQGFSALADETTPVGKLIAKTARLIGTLDAPAGLSNLTLDQADSGAVINIGVPPVEVKNPSATLVFNLVRNLSINSDIAIKSLTATEWLDDDETPDAISAPTLGKLTTKGNKKVGLAGDFQADLTLTGDPAAKATLAGAKVAGRLETATWDITGDSGAIAAGDSVDFTFNLHSTLKGLTLGDVDNLTLNFEGDAGALKFARLQNSALTAENIKSLAIVGNKKAAIPADWVDTTADFVTLAALSIKGNLAGGAITLSQVADPLTPKVQAMKSATIAGIVSGLAFRSAGHVGAFTAGRLVDSLVFAGVDDEVTALPTAFDDLADPAATLAKFTLKGIKGVADPALVNSSVAAGILGKVAAGTVTTSDGEDFGFAADKITALTATVNGSAVKLAALDDLAGEQITDNFVVRPL